MSSSTVKAGECALLGWSTDSSRDFIFFADRKEARYAGGDGPVDLQSKGKFPAIDYIDETGATVSLRLGEGEIMDGGMRYPGAVIATVSPDGWERVQPAAIIRSCQPK